MVAAFLAGAFLAATFFAAGLAGAASVSAASVAPVASVVLAPLADLAAAPLAPAFGSRASNSKPILPSGCFTRKALKLRPVRDDLKPVSRSVLPAVSSLPICSREISCCRMILPVVKSQVFSLPTAFSQTYFMPCS
ncbi:hypothetical protein D3C85_1437280 [compost metagenome]